MKHRIAILVCALIVTLSWGEDLPTPPILGSLRFEWPISNARLTSAFGYRSPVDLGAAGVGADTSLHFGIDIVPKKIVKNTQIYAAEAGEVSVVYPAPNGYFKGHPSFGGCVMVRHLVGTYGGKKIYAYTLYAHMKQVWVSEKTADKKPTPIKKGQALGLMGSTGKSSGPHLHFEILFDPLDFFAITAEVSKAEQAANLAIEARRALWYAQKGY